MKHVLIIGLITVLIGANPTHVLAQATINVTINADGDPSNDGDITLREALMIANGTRVAYDVFDPDIDGEVDHITGTPGAGVADTINVPSSIGTITIVEVLPDLNDSTDSIFAGSTTVIDGSALTTDLNDQVFAFGLSTDGHTIDGLTLQNFPGTTLNISGSNNTITAMTIKSSGQNGVRITGDTNTMNNIVVDGSKTFGIILLGGASGNMLDSVFVYNGDGTGILIMEE